MNHEELLKEIKTDLNKMKDEIVTKLDDYQKRVTKLETNEAWIKKAVVLSVTSVAGIVAWMIKEVVINSFKGQ